MEKQQEINSMGMVYIILLLGNILICALGIGLGIRGVNVPVAITTILCELAILVPVIIYIRSKNESITDSLGFHKIKFTTILLTALLSIAVTPIYMFANLVSQIFVSNTVVQSSGSMLDSSVIVTMFATSVMAPLFEEITFRGFFYNRLRDRSSVLKAAIVSAVLFGLMHLNLNQFCYAVVLGFVFALANQASGSTWTSVIMHFLINFVNIGLILLATLSLKEQNMDLAQMQEAARVETNPILLAVAVFGVISIFCVFIVWFLLKAIAKNEGNVDDFKLALSGKTASEPAIFGRVHSILNVPMMTGICIAVAAMIAAQLTVL